MEPLKSGRTAAVQIRLTPNERASIDAAAAAMHLGTSSFARVAILKAADLVPTPPPKRRRQPDELARSLAMWIGQLGRIGNVLNQTAHAANKGDAISLAAVQEARDEMRKLREIIVALRRDGDGEDE